MYKWVNLDMETDTKYFNFIISYYFNQRGITTVMIQMKSSVYLYL